MCKIVVNDANKNVEFIIYNHIFSKEKYEFTISELVEDLHQYHLDLTQEFVQSEVNDFIQSGLIVQNLRNYFVCSR